MVQLSSNDKQETIEKTISIYAMLLIIGDKVIIIIIMKTANSDNRAPMAVVTVFQKTKALTQNKKMLLIELHQSMCLALLITYSTNENVLS